MPDVTENVRQDDSAQSSTQDDGASAQDQKGSDTSSDQVVDQKVDDVVDTAPHPLEPGGDRFKQVYARAKDAESKYFAERERAARLEGELEATKRQSAQTVETPARYTGSQLQGYIDEGKITVGQALAYQEDTLKQELEKRVDAKVSETLDRHQRQSTIQAEIGGYKQLVPDAIQPGSANNIKLMQEFTYLVGLGYDKNDSRTEVMACRAAFGDVGVLKSKQQAQTIPTGRDTMQDISQNGKPKPDMKDLLNDLTAIQRKHYQKLIDKGVYQGGWNEVREELAFVPPR